MTIQGTRKVWLAILGGVAQLVALVVVVRSIEHVALAAIGAGQTPPPVDWLTVGLLITGIAVPFVGSAATNAHVHAQRAKYGASAPPPQKEG